MQARSLVVQGSVQEISGLPPANVATSGASMIVSITQFALLQVEAVEPFVQLMPKTDKDFEFKVYNLGNQFDFMKVGISENSREQLEDAGFNINIPISMVNVEPMVAPDPMGTAPPSGMEGDPMANMAPPDPMGTNPPPGSEADPMGGLDAALGGAMDQAMDQGAGAGAPDMGVPPDAGVEAPMDAPDVPEPDMPPPPDEPIVG